MKQIITVVPLGPGDVSMLTLQSAELLCGGSTVILRTDRHPVSDWLRKKKIPFSSLDSYYDRYEDFDEMHAAMASFLWTEAEKGALILGVMNPEMDGAVSALKKTVPDGGSLRILPGVITSDTCLSALPEDFRSSTGLLTCSATDFIGMSYHPAIPIMIPELNSPLLASDVKIHLSELYPDEQDVLFFPPSESAFREFKIIPLYQLDAQSAYDHTAAVYVPGVDYLHRDRHTFDDLAEIMRRLRAPDGCPWDRKQTHETLRPYMVEEAWETVNAIDEQDPDHLAEELGDVLFQVFFHASLGEGFDEFTMTDILSGICDKMIRRHPHVFGSSEAVSASEVSLSWEKMKSQQNGRQTVGEALDDVSAALPSLKYAIKIYKKLAQIPSLRREPQQVTEDIRKLSSALLENGRMNPETMSRMLMKCTELCRLSEEDAEILLHTGMDRFKKQYQDAEKLMLLDRQNPEELTYRQICEYLNRAEAARHGE